MRTWFACLALLLALPAHAQSERPWPLQGTWAVDVSRLPMPPQARPKSVTISFARTPAGAVATRVEVIDPAGGRVFAESSITPDGTPAAVQGNLEADMAATSLPAPGVMVMQLARGGAPASTRIYAVSDDGKSMVETVAFFDPAGRPGLRNNYFERVR
jgi:hypothetical protein